MLPYWFLCVHEGRTFSFHIHAHNIDKQIVLHMNFSFFLQYTPSYVRWKKGFFFLCAFHLHTLQSKKDSAIYEGYLSKQRNNGKGWDMRWFVLKEKSLEYYDAPGVSLDYFPSYLSILTAPILTTPLSISFPISPGQKMPRRNSNRRHDKH